MRLLIAPAGSGKTTLLLKYLSESTIAAGYCALPPQCGTADLYRAIATALALPRPASSYDDLLALLQEVRVRTELAVDDADNAAPDAIAILHRLVEDAPETLSFVYASRSRDVLDAKTWTAHGLAVLCDARKLAFDLAETQVLAEACGVSFTDVDISHLIEESDGWAIVVSGAVRCAAEDGRTLNGAFEHWRTRYGQLFAEFIAAELDRASEEDRALLRGIMAGALPDDESRLQRLEAQGFFMIDDDGGCRPCGPCGNCAAATRAHRTPPGLRRCRRACSATSKCGSAAPRSPGFANATSKSSNISCSNLPARRRAPSWLPRFGRMPTASWPRKACARRAATFAKRLPR